jgi:sRNA-binding protein
MLQANVGAALNDEHSAFAHKAERQQYARQRRKGASDQGKARYTRLANSLGFQEGDRVRLYRPTRRKAKSPKLKSYWEGPYNAITRINDVVYRIQRHPREKMMVVHLDRLAPYLGATRVD